MALSLGVLVLLPLVMLFLSGQWRLLGGMLLITMLFGVFLFGTMRTGVHRAAVGAAPPAVLVAPVPQPR